MCVCSYDDAHLYDFFLACEHMQNTNTHTVHQALINCVCVHRAIAFKEAQWQAREERARQHYEKLLEERKRRLEEQRMKEDKRRAAVEEKRRQKLEDDKVTTHMSYNFIMNSYLHIYFQFVHTNFIFTINCRST